MISLRTLSIAAAALAFATVPALAQDAAPPPAAQTAPPSDSGTPASGPSTQDLNGTVTTNLQDQQATNAANQAIYEADAASDQARYDETLKEHDRAVRRTDAHYRHQQRAYADAMSAWRIQVRDCLDGHKAACDMAPPDPASFY